MSTLGIISQQEARNLRAQRRAEARIAAQAARAQRQQQAQQQQNQAPMAANIDPDIQRAIDAAVAVVAAQLATTQGELTTARAELLQAQTDLNTLQNAQAPPAQQAAAQPPAAPTFALGPATIFGNIIDYSTPAGIKLYKMAGEKLKSDFDLDTNNFHQFVDNLNSRSIEQGWDQGLLVVAQGGINMNILQNYGTLTYTSVLAHVHTYIFRDNRLSQNSTNLFNCIEAALTKEAMGTMYVEKHLYTLQRGTTSRNNSSWR